MTDEFIQDTVEAAAGLAAFFVGVPEDAMVAALYDLEANLEASLQPFGADVASLIAETFCATVILRRRESQLLIMVTLGDTAGRGLEIIIRSELLAIERQFAVPHS
jgi:hypothetical protein